MGKLLDLLKASAGERNLRNALGRWRQAVSMEVDKIVAVGSGYDTVEDEGFALPQRSVLNFAGAGVTASDLGGKTLITIPGAPAPPASLPILFAQAQVLDHGQIITTDDDAVFDDPGPGNTIGYTATFGVFSLPLSPTERYIYALEFHGRFTTFGVPATGNVACTWVDAASNTPIWAGSSFSIPAISTLDSSELGTAKIIYKSPLTVAPSQDVKVRIVPTGLPVTLAVGSYAVVYRLGVSA